MLHKNCHNIRIGSVASTIKGEVLILTNDWALNSFPKCVVFRVDKSTWVSA